MRDKIIEVIYDQWCEGKVGMRTRNEDLELRLMKSIAKHFHASHKDYMFLEAEISAAMNGSEEIVFQDGFYLCLELLNGNYFRDSSKEKPRKNKMGKRASIKKKIERIICKK